MNVALLFCIGEGDVGEREREREGERERYFIFKNKL